VTLNFLAKAAQTHFRVEKASPRVQLLEITLNCKAGVYVMRPEGGQEVWKGLLSLEQDDRGFNLWTEQEGGREE
jgi:hypothetical protein